MIYVLFAILCGVTNVLSRSVNFVLSDKIGMYQSTFFNYVFGLAGSILILLISGETFKLFSKNLLIVVKVSSSKLSGVLSSKISLINILQSGSGSW